MLLSSNHNPNPNPNPNPHPHPNPNPNQDVPEGWPLSSAPLVGGETPSSLRDLAVSAHAAVARGGMAHGGTLEVVPPILW